MNNQISIIIPVLNEEAHIGKLLEHVLENASSKNIAEIIVVDGGSTDNTQNIIKAFTSFHKTSKKEAFHYIDSQVMETTSTSALPIITNILLIQSPKGRARQMNIGAKKSTGDILYFLHADSLPPKHFDEFILTEIRKGKLAGCFRMQFDSNHWWLKLASWFTKFSWRACRGGDQSLFITKYLFNDIEGFDEDYLIYEDNIMLNALYNKTPFVVINKTLKTSARMYRKHGVWKLQYFYWNIYIRQWLGADANALYKYYEKHVNVKL